MSERRSIPIARPHFGRSEERNLLAALRSGWVSQGPWVERLEESFVRATGAKYAVAVNSCTSAQMTAALWAGLGAGDEALVPAFTWISTATSVEFLGARPVFVDIDLKSFNIDPAAAEARVSDRTRALLPVHLFGMPADMKSLLATARRHRLRVIEDCACSLGASLGGRHTGLFGDCGCFSLHPRKSLTTGEGGVLVTNKAPLAREARALRSHGASASDYRRHGGSGSYRLPRYDRWGFNFRMTDLQAALGVAQMERMESVMAKRRRLAAAYGRLLTGHPLLRTPAPPEGGEHGWQAYVCLFGPAGIEEGGKAGIDRWNRRRGSVMKFLEERGVATRPGTHAVHIQEYYRRTYGLAPMDFPRAYAADRLSLALPLYHGLSARDQRFVAESLLAALERYA